MRSGRIVTLSEFLAEWNNSDSKILVHTSGSTGTPKPMWVEKQKMLNSARITCDFLGLQKGDNALLCMPLDYIAGKMMVVRSVLLDMNIVSVEPSNHPLKDLDTDIQFAAMVPSQVYCSLRVEAERKRLKRIKHLIIGGGAISESLSEEIKSLHSEDESKEHFIWSTYGMTETLSHIALRRLNGPDASEWYEPFNSVDVSQNEEGCLVIDAPLVHEGVLVTNDIAEIKTTNEGNSTHTCFRILGRKDNVICSGGIKLQIEKIEAALLPFLSRYIDNKTLAFCISKCIDEKFGEIAVLLIRNDVKIKEEDLQAAFSCLDRYCVPKKVVRVEHIPQTETGKIDRKAAQQLAKGTEQISR